MQRSYINVVQFFNDAVYENQTRLRASKREVVTKVIRAKIDGSKGVAHAYHFVKISNDALADFKPLDTIVGARLRNEILRSIEAPRFENQCVNGFNLTKNWFSPKYKKNNEASIGALVFDFASDRPIVSVILSTMVLNHENMLFSAKLISLIESICIELGKLTPEIHFQVNALRLSADSVNHAYKL